MPSARPLAPTVPERADAAPLHLHDLQACVQQLEQSPDFRVLRRLKPVLQWTPASGQAVTRIVVLDTETTGLSHAKDRIIELAMLQVDIDNATGLPVGRVRIYDGLEDPGMPIPAEVVAITGITDADVRGQRLDEATITQLLEGVDLVIAHNAGFDRPFVEQRLAAFAQLPWACSFADIDWKAQGRKSAKLESLALELGWFYDAHRAEVDCHALLAVLAAPLPKTAHTGLAQLILAAQQPSYRIQATNAPFEAKDLLKARSYRWNGEQKVWHTQLCDAQALQAEQAWLKAHVYHQHAATVQIETLDARSKYALRLGTVVQQTL